MIRSLFVRLESSQILIQLFKIHLVTAHLQKTAHWEIYS